MGFFRRNKRAHPPSFDDWKDVDIALGSEEYDFGPSYDSITSYSKWHAELDRWQWPFEEFRKQVESRNEKEPFLDEIDANQCAMYASQLLSVAQWLIILIPEYVEQKQDLEDKKQQLIEHSRFLKSWIERSGI